jgi:DNA-directed RNA polymerase I, II, and III subunit RPABC2
MTDKTIDINDKYKYKPLTEIKTIYVNPENRITSEVMTKFEYCQVIGIRAKQLEDYDNPFTDVGDISDPIEMAKKEIMDKKCPLSIIRVRTTNGTTTIAEKWQVNEMAIPYD